MATEPKTLTDSAKLRNLMGNAHRKGAEEDLVFACQARIAEIQGLKYDEGVEREFWESLFLQEEWKKQEKGKTILSSRARGKIKLVGVLKTVADCVLLKKTSGFDNLVSHNRPDLTAEAIALRNSSQFSQEVLDCARTRLEAAGVDMSKINL